MYSCIGKTNSRFRKQGGDQIWTLYFEFMGLLPSHIVTLTIILFSACKKRRENLIGYQKSQELHTQKGYFLYWFNVARARKSIRGHANLKIQLT